MKITSSTVNTFGTTTPAQYVSLAKGADGRILLATSTSYVLYTGWITSDGVKTSNSYTSTGAKIAGAPFAIAPADGRMAIFYRDQGNQLMYLREKADHTGWENPAWVAQALTGADPVVGRNANGQLEIFLLGTDGALYHVQTTSNGADGWKPAVKFGGGGARDVTMTTTPDGRHTVFHTNTAAQAWLIQQTSPNGSWSAFTNPAGGVTGPLAVAPAKNSALIGTFTSPDGTLFSFQQSTSGTWSGPAPMSFGQAAPNSQPNVRPTLLPGPTQGQLLSIHSGAGQQWILEEPATASAPWTVVAHTPNDAAGKVIGQAAVLDGTNLIVVSTYATGVQYTTHAYTA